MEKVLNRFYQSLNITTTLGLGHVSPKSIKTIVISIIQLFHYIFICNGIILSIYAVCV